VENFYSSPLFVAMGIKFGLDSLVVIEIAKDFASHVSLPKEGFIEYVECVKAISVVPQIVRQVAVVSHKEPKPYVEELPFPARVKENLLTSIVNKSPKRNCTPYKQVKVSSSLCTKRIK
jgi:hypothetical protein